MDFPVDGNHDEIIGGGSYLGAAPSKARQRLLGRIYRAFLETPEDSGWGDVLFGPFDVKFTSYVLVEPDFVSIRADRRHIARSRHVDGAPDIAVEVISLHNRNYDGMTKLMLYAAFGVPKFWLANSVRYGIRGLSLRAGAYYEIRQEANGRIRSVVTPELVLDPAKLLDNLNDETARRTIPGFADRELAVE